MKTFLLYFLFGVTLLFPSFAHGQEVITTSTVLASYQTRYGDFGRLHGRAHNIRHAAELVSGIVLQPNERFSFNERVGERTAENNFRTAPVIGSSRIRNGYGGGVCQLASTIYAAALYSGMRIIEHHQHSRVSHYIEPGLDATVDWGTKDLVFENPYSFPVILVINITEGRHSAEEIVIASFVAPEPGYEVNVYFVRHMVSSANIVQEVNPELAPGDTRVIEHGTPKISVFMRREIEDRSNGETIATERQYLVYPSSSRIIEVAPN